jgi:hypothetical protein
VHSAAIRTALERYNTAARALSPPRPTLSWEEVVEYAFLADFDLLRDARQDISQRPWATPTGRLCMDTHFKMRRAREEIQRLNVEIRRLATYFISKTRVLCTTLDSAGQSHRAHREGSLCTALYSVSYYTVQSCTVQYDTCTELHSAV